MKIGLVALVALGMSSVGLADFSYTVTTPKPLATQIDKYYFKGQKMKVEGADRSTILDFEAQTLTHINTALKLYSVTRFSDIPTPPQQTEVDVKVYVQETGRTKSIGGYEASEVILTADLDSPQIRQRPFKAQAERRLWLSTGVPGSEELRAFYERNRERFPWMALAEGAQTPPVNATAQAIQESAAEMDRKKSELKGVPVVEVHTVRAAAGGLHGPNTQDWAQARAQLEAQRNKGGPDAEKAAQALARADSMGGDPFAVVQNTSESSSFSSKPIPASVFAIPADYRLVTDADLAREVTEARAKQAPALGNGGVIGGIIGSVPAGAVSLPPPPPMAGQTNPPQRVTPQRIRVGGNVQQAKLVRQPKPVYPPLAKQARVSGRVLLNAIINKDGTIQNLTVVSGHPLLVPVAMEAVKQWVYQPTLLNGAAVEVVTQLEVNFTLSADDNARPLPSGKLGQHYQQTPRIDGPVVSGQQTWTLGSGSLPAGLRLDSTTGAIAGEPSAAGDFTFSVHVTNGESQADFSFVIHVDGE